MDYNGLYEFGCLQLKAADISDYKVDARLLLQFVTGEDRNFLFANGDKTVPGDKENAYRELIEKRKKHIPLQHLTHEQNFMGFDFYVNEDVLIPRYDTEVLVEEVLKELCDGMSIIDMCTGSGCILLSLLKLSNDCTGVGVDISAKALDVFKKNAESLNVNAKCIESDLFRNVTGTYDILTANPPYIRTCEIEELMPEVRDHEPFIALNGKENGLYFYERIVNECDPFLKRGSFVFFEIGEDQGAEVSRLLTEKGYGNVQVIKDLSGLDRVVKAVHG